MILDKSFLKYEVGSIDTPPEKTTLKTPSFIRVMADIAENNFHVLLKNPQYARKFISNLKNGLIVQTKIPYSTLNVTKHFINTKQSLLEENQLTP